MSPTAKGNRRARLPAVCVSLLMGLALTGGQAKGLNAESSASEALADTGSDVAVSAADSIRKYRFLARSTRQQKNYDEALEYYRQLLRYVPDDQKVRYFTGWVLSRMGRRGEAKAEFLRSAHLDSTHFNTNFALTQLLLAEGRADSAWLYLHRVLTAKPGEAKYRTFQRELADLLRKNGDIEGAVIQYTALSETAQSAEAAAELCGLLARLCEEQGESGDALAWHRKLLAIHEAAGYAAKSDSAGVKNHCETLDNIANLQVELGDIEQACQTLRQLVALDSANEYSYYLRMSELAGQTGDGMVELEALEGMAKANPRDLETVATLVKLHMSSGESVAAFDWVERGLSVQPEDSHLQLLKGDLLAGRGATTEAIAAYEVARSDPAWEAVAQQRIWQLRPPETREERLKREFFGDDVARSPGDAN